MTDLPDPIEQAAYYQDVNLKLVIAWFIDSMAITFITFLISLLTLGIGFFFFCGPVAYRDFFLSISWPYHLLFNHGNADDWH